MNISSGRRSALAEISEITYVLKYNIILTRFIINNLGRTNQLLEDLANEIRTRGGVCVPVVVDHANDGEVKAFFEKVENDEKGKLDVLVNNAYAAVSALFETMGKPFWTIDPVHIWDVVNNVGLRNHYLCTTYASK